MRLFHSGLIIWAFWSFLISQIASIPISEDLQALQFNNKKTLAPRNLAIDGSPVSLQSRADIKPPQAQCYQRGEKYATSASLAKYYIIGAEGDRASVRLQNIKGKGAQGSVYEGILTYYNTPENVKLVGEQDIGKRLPVAIKISKGGGGVDQALLQNRVNSEWVMKIREIFWLPESQESVQIMERGTHDMYKALQDKGPYFTAPAVIYGVGRAMGAAHAINITYRDMKPENVLFLQSGAFYLIDWDYATLAPGGVCKSVAGTPGYIGPEAINGESYDAFKNDLWGLAKVWLEASLWDKMGNQHFNDDVYHYLVRRQGGRTGTPGMTYQDVTRFLDDNFGTRLSDKEIWLMARGLCMQDDRFTMDQWLDHLRRAYSIRPV